MKKAKILYLHGMGGGKDSRTPRVLNEMLDDAEVIVRTYDFPPQKAVKQTKDWVEELKPDLIISESMGANYGILSGREIPHIYLSPAFGAPLWLGRAAFLSLIPGIPQLLGLIFKPREGDRQKLDFSYRICRQFRELRKLVIKELNDTKKADRKIPVRLYFGSKDSYRRWGVVNIGRCIRFFGRENCITDARGHFWEAERVENSHLCDEIRHILSQRNTH